MKISKKILQPYRLMFYFGLLSLAVLLFFEPYIRDYEAVNQVNLLTRLLALWIAIALLVFTINIPRIIKDVGLIVGLATILLLIIRAFASGNFIYELLPTSYSMIFMCSAIIVRKINITKDGYERINLFFIVVACIAFIYANSVAFGFIEYSKAIIVGEQRFSFFLDGNSAVLSIVIALAAFLSRPTLTIKILSCILVVLALVRLLSFSAKGPFAISLLIFVLMYIFFSRKNDRVLGISIMLVIFTVILFVATKSSIMASYLDTFSNRFHDQDTWLARLSEAENDFYAFLEEPLLGWGRNVPGFNILNESSSGHITLTGMLARLGLIGTFGLMFYYAIYFIKLKKSIRHTTKDIQEVRAVFFGTTIFVIFLLILGNPIFLFPAWAFLPLLFPSVDLGIMNEDHTYNR